MQKASPTVLRYLGALYSGGSLVGCSDGQLLERFSATNKDADRTEAELAFASLVERHGRMVWYVCRSLVLDDHDADDAFQATFLVLLTKAGTLQVRQTLAPWLYAVAYRTALNSRSMSTRRRAVEGEAATLGARAVHPDTFAADLERDELREMLHQAIMELPVRFRSAVVLCDLEGLSYLEAAASLRIPLGTLQSRLARARRMLRERLSRRGAIVPAIGSGLGSPWPEWITLATSLVPPRALSQRTCYLAKNWLNPRLERDAITATSIRELATIGSSVMLHSKRNGIAALLATAMIWGGVIAAQNQTPADTGSNEKPQSAEHPQVSQPTAPVNRLADGDLPITPAPQELNVAIGQGRARVYALDLAGNRIPVDAADPQGPSVEEGLEVRWAVVTGVVDHRAIQKSFSHGDDLAAPPVEWSYRRVDLQRQSQERGRGRAGVPSIRTRNIESSTNCRSACWNAPTRFSASIT